MSLPQRKRSPRKRPKNSNSQLKIMTMRGQRNIKKMEELTFFLCPECVPHLPSSRDILRVRDDLLGLKRNWPTCGKVLFGEMQVMKRTVWKGIFGNISKYAYAILFLPEKKVCVSPIKTLRSVTLEELSQISWKFSSKQSFIEIQSRLLEAQKWNTLWLVRKSNRLTSEKMKFASRILTNTFA